MVRVSIAESYQESASSAGMGLDRRSRVLTRAATTRIVTANLDRLPAVDTEPPGHRAEPVSLVILLWNDSDKQCQFRMLSN